MRVVQLMLEDVKHLFDALSRRAAEERGELLREHLWHQYETSGKISIGFRSCKGRDKSWAKVSPWNACNTNWRVYCAMYWFSGTKEFSWKLILPLCMQSVDTGICCFRKRILRPPQDRCGFRPKPIPFKETQARARPIWPWPMWLNTNKCIRLTYGSHD